MTTEKHSSDDVLRLIDELSAEAAHSDVEAREALTEAGIDPGELVRRVRERVTETVPGSEGLPRRSREAAEAGPRVPRSLPWWDVARTGSLGLAAAAAIAFVVVYHLDARASTDAQRQLARAQLISPLLPALASDDADRRSVALVVARQVDPDFAEQTSKQLTRWDMSAQAQARAGRNSLYATRILSGLEKLELSRDPDDRKVAIWNDLLPVLLEARKNRDDFVDVALDYQRVLPLLRVKNPDVFLDSYWGELWILNILLDSKIAPVVEAARRQAPEPTVVQHIYDQHAAGLPERDRRAFGEALAVYENAFKGLR